MTARALLSSLHARGVRLGVDGDKVTYDAPRGVLTDTDRKALRAHKQELLGLLTDAAMSDGRVVWGPQFRHTPLPKGACGVCGGTAWRLRTTPQHGGDWLWECAACLERHRAACGEGATQRRDD
jgi:hypothetical protein